MNIKIIDAAEGIVEGLGAPFSTDLEGEHFSLTTDFGTPGDLPLLFEHGLDPDLKDAPLGVVTSTRVDRMGLWVKAQLDRRHAYFEAVMKLIRSGALGFSSGAERGKTLRDATGAILKWPLIEISLTPIPAHPGAVVTSFKSLVKGTEMLDIESRRFLGDVATGLDDDALSIKALSRRGYDSDGTNITYRDVKLWPSQVFDAPQDDDAPDLQRLRNTIKIIAQPGYESAFDHYLRGAFRMMNGETAYAMLSQNDKKALSEGLDTAGGYFVPADFSAEVLARVAATAVVRGRAKVVPTSRDRYTQPAFAPHGSSPSVYSSGFVATWSPEAALWTDADPSFEIFEVSVRKLRIGAKISRDLANDAGGVAWLISNGADNLAVAEDLAFLTGSGVGFQPQGILNHPSLSTTNVAGTTPNTISNTAGADGSGSKMLTLAGSLPSQYQKDAILVMAAATETNIEKLIDAQRGWLFEREDEDGDGIRELLGFDCLNSPHMPADGVAGNLPVLLGNMSGYLIAARSLITLRLTERFADVDQLAVILADRVGGAVHNVDAFRAGVV